jgi:hypothetical protein
MGSSLWKAGIRFGLSWSCTWSAFPYQFIALSTDEMTDQPLNYRHMNLVVSGFVMEPEHWKYSSAKDYSSGKGLLDICLIG